MKRPNLYELRRQSIDAYNRACMHYLEDNITAHWMHLLFWAEANYEITRMPLFPPRIKTTARQSEQQKLAGHLRIITGMIGQSKHLRIVGNGMTFYPLDDVVKKLNEIEKSLRYLLGNISQRIPK